MSHTFGVLFTSTLLLGGVLAGFPVSAASAAPATTVQWSACPEDATVECGSLRLPVDYGNPADGTFDLAVARRKATDPAKRIGVLLINPGGPGGSGVDYALRPNLFSPDIYARFDVVGWDPRGVSRSRPVMCSTELLDHPASIFPVNQAEFDALGAYNRTLLDDCRRRTGPLAEHVDTASTAQDMDRIRRALGEQQINYFAASYGTLMGQQYAERYGDKIRTMVLDSNMDHSLGIWDYAGTESAAVEATFTEWVRWCGRTPSCALYGRDVIQLWHDVLAKADRGELTDPDHPGARLRAQDIINTVSYSLYRPVEYASLATYVRRLDEQPKSESARPRTAAGPEENSVYQAAVCSDWNFPIRTFAEYQALEARERALAPLMRGGTVGHTDITACVGVHDPVNNPQHPLKIRKAPQILMLDALYDPSTPYAWTVNAHQQSKDTTTLLTYDGWGHSSYDRSGSPCVRAAVDTYLTTGKAPAPDSHCAAVDPPGAVTAAAVRGDRGAAPLHAR
ncbi:transporter [Streptomyces sp. CB01201]|uniref:alpha/beta hydrolase n=1 Tax=Streptomyces sp. CB01201 TaxID=2020324 RepID=UPI000C27E6F1|nr:alpha/beta hydrolase [Streptomyces sp. CB01201]PJN01376.1 transporter [Streptomyces sp. CB01201]